MLEGAQQNGDIPTPTPQAMQSCVTILFACGPWSVWVCKIRSEIMRSLSFIEFWFEDKMFKAF